MEKQKILVLATLCLALTVFVGATLVQSVQAPTAVVLKTAGFPTHGNPAAWVEVTVFEDFLCHNCRLFNAEIYPKLRAQYIDAGKVRYTMVPLAFIKGSKPMANAALAVYYMAPDRFFAYVEALFHFPEGRKMNETALLEVAQKVGGISLARLQKAIDERTYYGQLRENLDWAKSVLGKDFRTPALYVNGIPTATHTFADLQMRIEHLLTIGKPK